MTDDELVEERAVFESTAGIGSGGAFEVVLISAGVSGGSRWEFSGDVIKPSVGLWDGAECFVDHDKGKHRSVRDIGGVFRQPRFELEDGGIYAKLEPFGPSGDLVSALGRELLAMELVDRPRVGFSADIGFKAKGKKVIEITRVFSVDLVFDPARGGAFVRALLSVSGSEDGEMGEEGVVEVVETLGEGVGEGGEGGSGGAVAEIEENLSAIRELTKVQEERAALADEVAASRALRLEGCSYLLDQGLAASKLPPAMARHVRGQFDGQVFEPAELTAAISDARQLVSELTGGRTVAGVGQVRGMFSSDDQLEAAVDDLLGAPRRAELSNLSVHRLLGVRDLYLGMTGDYNLHGGFYEDRVQFATTADFTGLVKNAMNKMVVEQWERLGRAGYSWWTNIAEIEHFTSLQQITGTLIGTVGALPSVVEGGAYTELDVGDSPETADFTKYGGYIPLTLELIDRDETRKLSEYPRQLASAGLRKISQLVAAIFTDNSHVGPTMADTGALFNNTAVTTAGGHANLLTTALGTTYTAWEAAAAAVYNQPQLIKNEAGIYGTGPKLAIDPSICLVPRALKGQAEALFVPRWSSEVESVAVSGGPSYGGHVMPVTVPEWTDANNWAAVCDPAISPSIYVGERFGIMPEIFIAGDERIGAVFSNDEHRIKVRHFLAVWVNDFRPLHKSNVA